MVYVLGTIIILFSIVMYMQYRSHKIRSAHITYIQEKLDQTITKHTEEKILLVTDDHQLRALLIGLNRLLEEKRNVIAEYTRTEASMKKMLSNISHDLKTPLTVVLGTIETILHDRSITTAERERLLQKVHQKAREVLELMNKFFDLAKIESGDQYLPLTKVNMNEICRKNILAFYEWITSKNLEVEIEIPEKNVYALANEEGVDRVLHNLLANAVQYGGDGNVIGITVRHDDHDVYVDVWDKGKGIREGDQDHVFERMYTLEDSRNKKYQVSGIGLTISKRLLDKMGGRISLLSEPYVRTVFTCKLKKAPF
jgi:signal transduction histidine kinase